MPEFAELVARYKRLRAVSRRINERLVKALGKDVLDEGARALGFYQRGRFEFENETEMAVLMDYCIHHVRAGGMTAVERYVRENPTQDADELLILRAMEQSFYSLFQVEEQIRGVGIRVIDVAGNNESLFVTDVGLSQSAVAGSVLASQLLLLDEFAMTSGAALPLGVADEKTRADLNLAVQAAIAEQPADARGIADPTSLIRELLAKGAALDVHYSEVGRRNPRRQPTTTRHSASRAAPVKRKLSRNDPCPCGSGKKFKNCCQK